MAKKNKFNWAWIIGVLIVFLVIAIKDYIVEQIGTANLILYTAGLLAIILILTRRSLTKILNRIGKSFN